MNAADLRKTLSARLWSPVTLHANTIACGGRTWEPDEATAYCEFKLAHGFPCISAYGTAVHPGTVANSYLSLVGKPINYAHMMRVNDRSKDKDEIRRDYILGAVMAAEFPQAPLGGWKMGNDREQSPGIRAVGSIFKMAEKVPGVLGEHLGGRHRWTVSMEMRYELIDSGFLIGDRAAGTKAQKALMDEVTPKEVTDLGFGYISVEQMPDDVAPELLGCWDFKKSRIAANWGKLPVTLLMGGINGRTAFHGVGLVRYGAEREAEIQQILATDPDRLTDSGETDFAALLAWFAEVEKNHEKLLTHISNCAGTAA
jgi:hypothetical protein